MKLTPLQAVEVIDRVTASVQGTRALHQQIAEAIGVLLEVVTAASAKAEPEKNDAKTE